MPKLLFTDNHTNNERLFQAPNESPYVKDAFHDYVIQGRSDAVNPAATGTKAAAHYVLNIAAQDSTTVDIAALRRRRGPARALWGGL